MPSDRAKNFDLQNPRHLYFLYFSKGLERDEIANFLGVTEDEVEFRFTQHRIPNRGAVVGATYPEAGEPYKDRQMLIKLYWYDGLELEEIGSRFRVSEGTIRYHMVRHDIPRRTRGPTRNEVKEAREARVKGDVAEGSYGP